MKPIRRDEPEITPFSAHELPPLGLAVLISQATTKPTGERFAKGESAVISEHLLNTDGRISVGARTPDGRVLRALFREAFEPAE